MKTPSRNNLKIRLYTLAIVGLLAIAFVTWGLTERVNQSPSDKVQLASVWIDTVQEGDFERSVRGPGVLEINEDAADDSEGLKAVIQIFNQQAEGLQVGQNASVDTRRGVLQGEVAAIGPAGKNGTTSVDLRIGPEALHTGMEDGMPVDANIHIETINNAIFLGRPAYGQAGSVVGLFKVAEDGTAERVEVRLGRISIQHVEILNGLEVGDRVILSDSSSWDDFDRIYLQ